MNTTHTPGPWKVEMWEYPQRTPPQTIPTITNTKDAIAQTCILYRDPQDAEAESLANARLIAAAPDLLAACNNLLKTVCFGDHGNIKDNGYICLAVTSTEICAVKAAIAKAETNKS